MEKGKRMGRKCGADWLTAGGRRASERSRERINIFAPKTIRQICDENFWGNSHADTEIFCIGIY